MKEYPETHQEGLITLENPNAMSGKFMQGDFGIQIAKDGRVWVCINGVVFLRFVPEFKRNIAVKGEPCLV